MIPRKYSMDHSLLIARFINKTISTRVSLHSSLLCYAFLLQFPIFFFVANYPIPFYPYKNVKKQQEYHFFDISSPDIYNQNLLIHKPLYTFEKQGDKNQETKLLGDSFHRTQKQDVHNTNQNPYHSDIGQQQVHFSPYLCNIPFLALFSVLPIVGNHKDCFNTFGDRNE